MILYACADLIFASRISAGAKALGLPSAAVRTVEKLVQRLDEAARDDSLTVIIDLDLADRGLTLIDAARAHPANPRIIAFGPHVDKERLAAAKAHGADEVLARSVFTAKLDEVLTGAGTR